MEHKIGDTVRIQSKWVIEAFKLRRIETLNMENCEKAWETEAVIEEIEEEYFRLSNGYYVHEKLIMSEV